MTATDVQPRDGFLRLPPEIRESIYRELFRPANNVEHFDNGYKRYTFDLRLLRANQQIYYEARRVLRRLNVFVAVQTPWPEAERHIAIEGYVPVMVSGDTALQFDLHHLLVDIGSPHYRLAGQPDRRFVLHLDDLPAFCKIWYYSDLTQQGLNSLLRLTLQLRDPYAFDAAPTSISKDMQRRLLDPFGLLKGLREVIVQGEHYPSIEKSMRDEMAKPYTAPEDCLEEAERLKEAGNKALQNGRYQEAIKIYSESFRAIHIIIEGRRRSIWADSFFQCELSRGTFKGQHAQLVRLALRVKLVANMVLALLKLDEINEAHYWGMRSITLMREAVEGEEPVMDFVAAEQMGKIYYRTALACRRLGEDVEARQLLNVASQYLPRDEIVRKELESLTLRIG
jgi:tetratricopeptide (TPR) repeat protein